MFRSNQPYPFQIKNDIKKNNIKTIINLRGKRHCSSYYLEEKTCKEERINLINFPMSSRDLPDKRKIIKLNKIFNTIEYPALMHCKSGADRAGFASALYLILKKEKSVVEAKQQLHIKHLHIKLAKTGILDYFFEQAISTNANYSKDFIKWIKFKYDKKRLKNNFKYKKIWSFITEFLFRRE